MGKLKKPAILAGILLTAFLLGNAAFAASYTVKPGDTLSSIASAFSARADTVIQDNDLKSGMIYPGQVLYVRGKTISYSQRDLRLLARLITAEADGEPYEAKVGVGAVVVNRVKNGDFGDNISSVIYQKCDGYYQFTPVENGWINVQPSKASINAAKAALQGSNPVGPALFYFDNSTTSIWIWSKQITARIGHMIYAY